MANLKLELCKATFTEEKVTLVAQYVEKLKPDLKEMLDRLTAIHLIYQMVRGVWLRVKSSDSFLFYQIKVDCQHLSIHLSSLKTSKNVRFSRALQNDLCSSVNLCLDQRPFGLGQGYVRDTVIRFGRLLPHCLMTPQEKLHE